MSARPSVHRFERVRSAVPWLLPLVTALSVSVGEIRHEHVPADPGPGPARQPEIRTDLRSCRDAVPFHTALERHAPRAAALPRHEVFREDHPIYEVADVPGSEDEEHFLYGPQEGIADVPGGAGERTGRSRRLMAADARKAVRLCLYTSGVTARPPPTVVGADIAGC